MNDPYPVPSVGRRSNGMEEQDWQQLACAYDTWNDHVASGSEIDEDLKSFVRDVFSQQGLWNDFTDEPNLQQFRTMYYHRC